LTRDTDCQDYFAAFALSPNLPKPSLIPRGNTNRHIDRDWRLRHQAAQRLSQTVNLPFRVLKRMSTLSLSTQAAIRKPSRDRASYYTLTWRQKQLLLTLSPTQTTPLLPALESEQLLADCLKRSPIHLVKLTPDIGEAELALWADACDKVNKPVYLNVPSMAALPKKQNRLKWGLKRLVDWSAAALLLTVIGPLMLGLSFLIRLQSPGPIFFSQWRVGERGRLFRILKFRTMVTGAELYHHQVMGHQAGLHKCENDPRVTPIGRWMRKYSLDELPQLFNVLRGEMSLVGPRPWALYDAVRLSPAVTLECLTGYYRHLASHGSIAPPGSGCGEPS
jgi:lipopolysaccharide/colanic/teichoic acid biosynthesis glycosyltransferase